MKQFLYAVVELIAKAHEKILTLNDAYEYNFSDKELHFIIIGVIGMLILFVVHPLFTWLAKNDHVLIISWMYVFTVILVLTFAIEIGQRVTHTGIMEFEDIVFGIGGFMLMFLAFALLRALVLAIAGAVNEARRRDRR